MRGRQRYPATSAPTPPRLRAALRAIWHRAGDETGAVSFEAIWVGLFLAFLLAPTAFLYRWADTHLYASWAQRTSARNHAMTGICNESSLIGIGAANARSDDNTLSTILCSQRDPEHGSGEPFWDRMSEVVSDDFPTLVDDMKDEGDIHMHNGHRRTMLKRNLSIGEGGGAIADATAMAKSGSDSWDFLVPSSDYYLWKEEHWQKGHDRVIWEDFTSKSQKMFPNVFPSR